MFATTWLRMRGSSDSATVRYDPGHRPNTRWVEALHCDSVTTQQPHLIKDPLHLHHISENELRALSQKDVIKSMNVFFHVDWANGYLEAYIRKALFQESTVSGFFVVKNSFSFVKACDMPWVGGSCLAGGTSMTALMHVDWALKCGLWVKPSLYLSAAVCN